MQAHCMDNFNKVLDSVSQALLKPRVFIKIYLGYLSFYLCKAIYKLDFPNNFNWGELFINYEGGFARRGLLGEFFYLLQPICSVRYIAPIFFATIFFYFLKISWGKLSASFGQISSLVIFSCPAWFIFQVKDYEAFMRKDIIFELLILITLINIVKCWQKRVSLSFTTILFTLCFLISCLIHEIAITLWPLAACLLGLLYWREKRIVSWFIYMGLLFVSLLLVTIYLPGTTETKNAICGSWQIYYPEFMCGGGLRYIGEPVSAILPDTHRYHTSFMAVSSFIWGIFLTALPLIWLCWGYRLLPAISRLFPIWLLLLLPFALIAPWLYFTFAADWGRNISMATLDYLFFLWAIQAMVKNPGARWLEKLSLNMKRSVKTRCCFLGSLILYGTSWTLYHWVPHGTPFVHWSGLPDFFIYLLK